MAAIISRTGATIYPMQVSKAQKADRFFEFGRFLFALGLAMLGIQIPLVADFVRGLEPVPASLPLQLPLAYLSAVILLGASLLIASGQRLRTGALAAALLFLVWLALLQLPRLAAQPNDGNGWTTTCEVLAMFATAWLLAAEARPPAATRIGWMTAGGVWAPRIFGVCLLAFGALHFVYHDYVASVIPAWIPGHTFFAYFTGVAHIAAGVAIITGVLARFAATLLGGMFLSWVVLLHIPRVAAAPDSRAEWTSLLIAITLSGAAWLVAGRFAPRATRTPARLDSGNQNGLSSDAPNMQAPLLGASMQQANEAA